VKRSAMPPRTKPMKRGRKKVYGNVEERAQFKRDVLEREHGRCRGKLYSAKPCDGPIQAHHVVSQQTLKRRGLETRLWWSDNGIALCRRHHDRHTLATERVPYDCLPTVSVLFAISTHTEDELDRLYGEDPQTTRRTEPSE
jgi:hypothetical protein